MYAYYNEHDKATAEWLRQLIRNGDITQGEVDDRDIREVVAADIKGFTRVHWFAGIGTWDYALNKAGWGDRPIWTASLPCQPFSAAGKQLGKADERHLLPHYLELVKQCRPYIQIGEQVERAIAHGWLDDLQTVMEAEGYAVGHCVLGAHSINAAHIRQRLYWVANAIGNSDKREINGIGREAQTAETINRENVVESGESCGTGTNVRGMGNAEYPRLEGYSWNENSIHEQGRNGKEQTGPITETGSDSGLGDTKYEQYERVVYGYKEEFGQNSERETSELTRSMQTAGEIEWLYCRDKKYRPIKSGIKPLVDGSTRKLVCSSNPSAPIEANNTQEARTLRLKGYGNAIQAQTAEAFIRAFMGVV